MQSAIGNETEMNSAPIQLPRNSQTTTDSLTLSARRVKLHLAQNVARARHRAGWTQLQLADAAELSRATVHLIEAGVCDARLSTVARLANALQTDALDLLMGESLG
jgi:DNA-binding XRE family transcriptional regulator